MKDASFRIIFFPKCNRYVGVAWNYNEAVLISTRDHESYTGAREELGKTCEERNVNLTWFDGEYEAQGELLVPRVS